ncbi:MAG: hypothetical protein R3C28_22870 [Pirellulaceae bacterium]
MAGSSWLRTPSELTALGTVMGDSGLVILRPAEWIGKRLPLASVAHLPDEVLHDEWIVILHSRDCDHCREIVPTLLPRAPLADNSASLQVRIALVDVKPGEPIYPASRTIVSTTLPATHEWFVSPPVAIRIHDGQVTDVCENKDELNAFVHRSPISHPSPTRQRGTACLHPSPTRPTRQQRTTETQENHSPTLRAMKNHDSHPSPTRQRGTPIPDAWALAPDVSQRGPWASAQTAGMKLEPSFRTTPQEATHDSI